MGKAPLTRDEKMQIFRKASQLGPQETRFYLEANEWELSEALSQWRAEIRWEAEQVREGCPPHRCARVPLPRCFFA